MVRYNIDNFKNKKTNICFITGLSGCGKTTLAKKLVKNHGYVHIDLDDFEQCSVFPTLEDVKKDAGEIFYLYFLNHKDIYKNLKDGNFHGERLCFEIKKFLYFVIEYCKNHNEKYILEGVQIYSFLKPENICKHSYIIIDKNVLICLFRRIKRNLSYGYNLEDLEIIEAVKWYVSEHKIFKNLYKKI